MKRIERKNYNVKSKNSLLIKFFFLLLIIAVIFIYNNRGTASYNELKGIEVGTSTEKVQEYFGSPKEKTIDRMEILKWAPDNIAFSEASYPDLEMYSYKIESGNMARLFFSVEKLIDKTPSGLNKTK